MKIHDLLQGSEAWCAFRLEHFGASEAAAMLGLSKTVKRTELLHAKHTGNPREFSDFVQKRILDHGHAVEAKARPIIEAEIGDDLYPITCSAGRLSASCDGITLGHEVAFEHKQWNEILAAQVEHGSVPDEHMPQCQQILLVTGAEKVLFVVSDGTTERMVSTEVLPDPAWFERIETGWLQFAKDLATYVPPADAEPAPIGKAPQSLPALRIEVTGQVTASNLAEFKQTALAAIRGVNRELKTDADFADAAESVKWCEDVEGRLAAAKQHALSQTTSIDELFRTVDEISAEARAVRLELDKLVTRRKTEIKDSIVLAARRAYDAHVDALKTETEGVWFAIAQPDFAAAAKNKRTVTSLQDAVDTALATGKIAADAQARTLRAALGCLKTESAGFEFLFADKHALAQKPLDDLKLAIKARIDAHKAAEAEKERAKQAALQPVVAAPAPVPAVATIQARPVPAARPAVQADTRPPITTGALCERLGFTVTAEFVKELGIVPAPAPVRKAGTWWHAADFPRICAALVEHLQRIAEPVEA